MQYAKIYQHYVMLLRQKLVSSSARRLIPGLIIKEGRAELSFSTCWQKEGVDVGHSSFRRGAPVSSVLPTHRKGMSHIRCLHYNLDLLPLWLPSLPCPAAPENLQVFLDFFSFTDHPAGAASPLPCQM